MLRSAFTPDRTTCNPNRDDENHNTKPTNGPSGAEGREPALAKAQKNDALAAYDSLI